MTVSTTYCEAVFRPSRAICCHWWTDLALSQPQNGLPRWWSSSVTCMTDVKVCLPRYIYLYNHLTLVASAIPRPYDILPLVTTMASNVSSDPSGHDMPAKITPTEARQHKVVTEVNGHDWGMSSPPPFDPLPAYVDTSLTLHPSLPRLPRPRPPAKGHRLSHPRLPGLFPRLALPNPSPPEPRPTLYRAGLHGLRRHRHLRRSARLRLQIARRRYRGHLCPARHLQHCSRRP